MTNSHPPGLSAHLLKRQRTPPSKPAPPPLASSPPARISLPCVHEAGPAPPPPGQSVIRSYLHCGAGKGIDGVVCRCLCNSNCSLYTPEYPDEESSVVQTTSNPDLRAGVVIGHYGLPGLVELQVKVIRALNGPVPILICDDYTSEPLQSRLVSVCKREGVPLVKTGQGRIGHAGGDIGSLFRGLQWAEATGLKVLVKLSQRLVFTKPNWLALTVEELRRSGKPTLSDRCVEGLVHLPMRTEGTVLDVAKWTADGNKVKSLYPRRISPTPAEVLVADVASRVGEVGIWSLLNGPDRLKPSPYGLWHCSSAMADYKRLAKAYAVDLGKEFFTSGWYHRPDHLPG